jgi:hypothetical protein
MKSELKTDKQSKIYQAESTVSKISTGTKGVFLTSEFYYLYTSIIKKENK